MRGLCEDDYRRTAGGGTEEKAESEQSGDHKQTRNNKSKTAFQLLIEIEFILQIYLQSKSMFANNFAKHL